MPDSEAENPSWQGKLSLLYERRAAKTIVAEVQVQAPLKVQRPFTQRVRSAIALSYIRQAE